MQGELVEESVIAALNSIFSQADNFDCVVIIRGGGATADMSGFDTLALAENVAQFPLPIITGIGHERDESILDMVSHTRVKTPTAAAAFLVDNLDKVMKRISNCEERMDYYTRHLIENHAIRLKSIAERIPMLFSLVRTKSEARIEQLSASLTTMIKTLLEREHLQLSQHDARLAAALSHRLLTEQHRMELLQQRAQSLDPTLLLKRGYSITTFNGKTVRDVSNLQSGDEIETRLEKGIIKSVVK